MMTPTMLQEVIREGMTSMKAIVKGSIFKNNLIYQKEIKIIIKNLLLITVKAIHQDKIEEDMITVDKMDMVKGIMIDKT